MALNKEEISALACEPDPATKHYYINHINYRIKDPKRTVDFYTRVLGMRLLWQYEMPVWKTTLYFLGYDEGEVPKEEEKMSEYIFSRRFPSLELVHIWGSEKDPDFKWHTGHTQPGKGWGYIAVHVPDVYSACERLDKLGVDFIKRPGSGTLRGYAYVRDPDGYWLEITQSEMVEDPTGTDPEEVLKSYSME